MNFTFRAVQNKAKRESKEVKLKQLQEYRKEIQKLKRENARLRRDLEKFCGFEVEYEEEKTLAETDDSPPISPVAECPDCHTNTLTEINLGVKILVVCTQCKWRKAKK